MLQVYVDIALDSYLSGVYIYAGVVPRNELSDQSLSKCVDDATFPVVEYVATLSFFCIEL